MDPVKCSVCGQTNRPMRVRQPGGGVAYQCGNAWGCTEILDVAGERPGASEPTSAGTTAAPPVAPTVTTPARQPNTPGALTGADIVASTTARLAVVRDRLVALRAELRSLTDEEAMLERIAAVVAPPTTTRPEDRPS